MPPPPEKTLQLIFTPGDGTQHFFKISTYATQISKVRCLELISWLETGVLGTKFCKISISGAENRQNWQKMGLKRHPFFFFEQMEVGSLEQKKKIIENWA